MTSLPVIIVFSLLIASTTAQMPATKATSCTNNAGSCYGGGRCPTGYQCSGLESGICCPTFTITTTRPTPGCVDTDITGPCMAGKCPTGSVCKGGDCCSTCADSDPECPYWASNGFCTNPFYAGSVGTCLKTCKLC